MKHTKNRQKPDANGIKGRFLRHFGTDFEKNRNNYPVFSDIM
jgi:hypothetical protein